MHIGPRHFSPVTESLTSRWINGTLSIVNFSDKFPKSPISNDCMHQRGMVNGIEIKKKENGETSITVKFAKGSKVLQLLKSYLHRWNDKEASETLIWGAKHVHEKVVKV